MGSRSGHSGQRLVRHCRPYFAVPVTAVLYRLLADWTNERARQRGVPIIDTVPGVKYDLRGHVRRSFKKKKIKLRPAPEG